MSLKNLFFCSFKLAILPVILFWPIIRWIFAFDVFFQFLAIFLNWHGPNTRSIVNFLVHFSILTILTFIISSNETYKKRAKF